MHKKWICYSQQSPRFFFTQKIFVPLPLSGIIVWQRKISHLPQVLALLQQWYCVVFTPEYIVGRMLKNFKKNKYWTDKGSFSFSLDTCSLYLRTPVCTLGWSTSWSWLRTQTQNTSSPGKKTRCPPRSDSLARRLCKRGLPRPGNITCVLRST